MFVGSVRLFVGLIQLKKSFYHPRVNCFTLGVTREQRLEEVRCFLDFLSLWIKSCSVAIQRKRLLKPFRIVLLVLVLLQNEIRKFCRKFTFGHFGDKKDNRNKIYSSVKTLSLPESKMKFSEVVQTFEFVEEILWCDHSNETSSAVLSHVSQ